MTNVDHSILKVLIYYDIFRWPLTEREIQDHLKDRSLAEEVGDSLHRLTVSDIIHKVGPYYTLQNNSSIAATRRERGNKIAAQLLPRAEAISRLLNSFPFVRGVCISGSLSKNYADESSDFDYFIITKANRLWIANTLLGLFKKLSYLTGKQHCFCMNYFIDESYLEIPEHNIFTATELFTLKAGSGPDTIRQFLGANAWVKQFYGNYRTERHPGKIPYFGYLLRNAFEFLLDTFGGEYLDNWLMRKAVSRWNRKKQKGALVDLKGNPINLYLTGKHYCKHDPKYFQARVLAAYSEKMQNIESLCPISEGKQIYGKA